MVCDNSASSPGSVIVFCRIGTFPRLHQPGLTAQTSRMARTTVTFSISLPPEMAAELEEIQRKEHRTRSELIREALRRYIAVASHMHQK